MKYILSIDQGTTSTRAILFDKTGKKINQSQMEFTQICPQAGYVLHNPKEIIETVYEVIKNVLNKENINLNDIEAIGIANQRETTVMWDKETSEPIYDAIVWQSRQSQSICEEWIKKGYGHQIYKKTGLLINPYFSASKIKWILNHTNKYEEAKNGKILFGTIDTWILYNLTKKHLTDYTNASRTMMFNIEKLEWDDDLLSMYDIPKSILPEVKPTAYNFGEVEINGIDGKTPITCMIGDQQASLFGQCCFEYGDIKNTYGTGCFMLMNLKEKLLYANGGLLTTIAYGYNGEVNYALEGSVFVAGAAVQWLRDGLRIINSAKETEEATSLVSENEIYIVPAFVGLGTPYWDNDARGAIFGITRATKKEHFIKATLESIAYQTRDVMEVMEEAADTKISHLSVDGGASENNYLIQFQADLLQAKISRPSCLETTALGAAYLAGLHTKYYKDLESIKKFHEINQFFFPIKDCNQLYEKWKKAVAATRVFK